jgi:TetR/AcrR family transcriptional regulator, repressor for uid operon
MCPKVSVQYKIKAKEKIVESALISFSKYGYDRTRMEDISEAAKVSKGTLYLYFRSKEELFYAISERNITKLKEQLSTLFTTKKEDLILNAEKFYDNFHKEIGQDFEKVFFEIIAESSRNSRLQKMLCEQRIKTFDVIIEYLNLQVQRGFINKDTDIKAIAAGLVSLFDGLSISKVLGISESKNKQAWIGTVKTIFNGIG